MNNCEECIFKGSLGCSQWECEERLALLNEHDEKIKNEAFEEFAEWLVKYNVIRGGAMGELLRDFKCEKGYK